MLVFLGYTISIMTALPDLYGDFTYLSQRSVILGLAIGSGLLTKLEIHVPLVTGKIHIYTASQYSTAVLFRTLPAGEYKLDHCYTV